MDALKTTAELLFSPAGIVVLLAAGGLIASAFRSRSRIGHRLLFYSALLFLVFTFSPLSEILLARLERDYPPLLEPPRAPGPLSIVVLSGYGEEHPGLPVTSSLTGETQCRLAEGIRLYRRAGAAKLILSGGVLRRGDPSVAHQMAEYVRQLGIPENDIVIEGHSRTTYENLLEVRKHVQSGPFVLVTSACDLRRATAVARKLGMHPIAAPACIHALPHYSPDMAWGPWTWEVLAGFVHPSAARWTYLQRVYHEHLGYLWYKLLGRI